MLKSQGNETEDKFVDRLLEFADHHDSSRVGHDAEDSKTEMENKQSSCAISRSRKMWLRGKRYEV